MAGACLGNQSCEKLNSSTSRYSAKLCTSAITDASRSPATDSTMSRTSGLLCFWMEQCSSFTRTRYSGLRRVVRYAQLPLQCTCLCAEVWHCYMDGSGLTST